MSSKVTELQTATQVNNPPTRGTLFVVSSPSGGGKGTLIRRVLDVVDNLSYSVSYTTRGPRANEVNGREYFFIDRADVRRDDRRRRVSRMGVRARQLLRALRSDRLRRRRRRRIDMISRSRRTGRRSVRQLLMDSVSVFILPPSFRGVEATSVRARDRLA